MAEFKGYLVKFGTTEFPHKYIKYNSYKSYDNQRTEIKASRNASNHLQRETSPNFKSKVEFELIEGLHLKEWEKIKKIIDGHISDKIQRKVAIQYWNHEDMRYKIMTTYIPDIEFDVKSITESDIVYDKIRLAFIEY